MPTDGHSNRDCPQAISLNRGLVLRVRTRHHLPIGYGERVARLIDPKSSMEGPIVTKVIVNTSDAPGSSADGSLPYSQAVIAAGLVFVSGQFPFDPATGAVVGETIGEQTRQCFRNIDVILRAAGSSMDKVVAATFILRHPEDIAGMNEEWLRWFPTDPPARQGAKHPLEVEGLRISIAVVAEA